MRPVISGGFTLIELMISITLSQLALAAVLAAYLSGSRANQAMQQRVTLQQDARVAMTSLTRDLRMAGAFGCALPDSDAGQPGMTDAVSASSAKWLHFMPGKIGIYEQTANGSGWVNASNFTPEGKALIIQYGTGDVDAEVTANTSGHISNIKATLAPDQSAIANAAVLVLSNCQQLTFFTNNGSRNGNTFSVSPDGGLTSQSRGNPQWELMRLATLAYSVGTYQGRKGLYLFELDEDGQWRGPKEIANGVSNFTAEYGIQQCNPGTDEDINTRYYRGDNLSASDWRKVSLVRLQFDISRTGLSAASGTETTIQRHYATTVALRRENLCLTQPAN